MSKSFSLAQLLILILALRSQFTLQLVLDVRMQPIVDAVDRKDDAMSAAAKLQVPRLISVNSYIALANLVESTATGSTQGNITHYGIANAAQALAHNSGGPWVVFAHRPGGALDRFLAGVERLELLNIPLSPFVLIAANGDPPLDYHLQLRISNLKSVRACYGTNKMSSNFAKIYPLPIGLAYHHVPYDESVVPAVQKLRVGRSNNKSHKMPSSVFSDAFSVTMQRLVASTNESAPAWAQRDPRLLVGPLSHSHPDRAAYKSVLRRPEYAHLVRFVDQRFSIQGYFNLLAQHRAVLSPRGNGYDCFRHWEALAVGTTPLVQNDAQMDQRLFESTGAVYIPHPHDLTPEILQGILQNLQSPNMYAAKMTSAWWRSKWSSHF